MLGCRARQVDRNLSLNMNNQYMFQLGNQYPQAPSKKPVGVFWDLENCSIPRGLNIYALVSKIRTIFGHFNLIEREFAVVCDVYGIGHHVINELNEMQLDVLHVCSYSKNASDEKIKQMIYRFVMVHGHFSAIILLSSDINFAPILSDIRNRVGASVILFHHRQVSPALVACAHHNIDFDYFCSQIPVIIGPEPENVATYMVISNWPRFFSEETTRSYLNRITGNCGGRVLRIDFRACEANVIFKCRSDAQRCLQRVNNRRIHGTTLKARINEKTERNPLVLNPLRPIRSVAAAPNRLVEADTSRMVEPVVAPVLPSEADSDDPPVTHRETASLLNKLKANRCDWCTHRSKNISRYTNHLFQQQILNVHISLSKLAEGMEHLFELHDGKMPLNSLPNCWMAEFDEELDTITEPKVMLEHLLACLPTVAFAYDTVTVKGELITVKFVLKSTPTSANNSKVAKCIQMKKLSKKQRARLRTEFSPRLHSLIVASKDTSLTSFPSILLSSLPDKYHQMFRKALCLAKFGAGSLFELVSLLSDHYNLYSYEDDFVVTLNLKGHLKRFAQELHQAVSSLSTSDQTILSGSEVSMEVLQQLFKSHYGVDLNVATYGVCFLEDLLESRNLPDNESDEEIISPRLPGVETEEEEEVEKEDEEVTTTEIVDLKRCIPLVQQLLQSLPNWSIKLRLLYQHFRAILQSQVNLPPKCSYEQFVKLFSTLAPRRFRIERCDNEQWLMLSPKLQQLELAKRLLQVFYLMELLGNHHGPECHCLISFPIDHIFAQYHLQFDAHADLHRTFTTTTTTSNGTSLSKVFERALTRLYQSQATEPSLFLVYTSSGVLLQQCDPHWIDEQVLLLFTLLFQSPSYSLSWQQLNTLISERRGYRLGASALAHRRFREVICLKKDESNPENVHIKLSLIYELAAMFIAVMLLHSETSTSTEWTIAQLEAEYYDHFGIAIPVALHSADYRSLFQRIGLLFATTDHHHLSSSTELRVSIKRPDLFKSLLLSERIPTCNYCEKSTSEVEAEEEDKSSSGRKVPLSTGDSGHSSDTSPPLSEPDKLASTHLFAC